MGGLLLLLDSRQLHRDGLLLHLHRAGKVIQPQQHMLHELGHRVSRRGRGRRNRRGRVAALLAAEVGQGMLVRSWGDVRQRGIGHGCLVIPWQRQGRSGETPLVLLVRDVGG